MPHFRFCEAFDVRLAQISVCNFVRSARKSKNQGLFCANCTLCYALYSYYNIFSMNIQ